MTAAFIRKYGSWWDIRSARYGNIMIRHVNDELALEEAAKRWGTTFDELVDGGATVVLAGG